MRPISHLSKCRRIAQNVPILVPCEQIFHSTISLETFPKLNKRSRFLNYSNKFLREETPETKQPKTKLTKQPN
ncbi:MAG: hypothetical protein ACTS6G_03445 [Candidatus Hodgkinia cicadicola]